jgi:hypothetical protein
LSLFDISAKVYHFSPLVHRSAFLAILNLAFAVELAHPLDSSFFHSLLLMISICLSMLFYHHLILLLFILIGHILFLRIVNYLHTLFSLLLVLFLILLTLFEPLHDFLTAHLI